MNAPAVHEWGADRLDELAALVAAALPDETVGPDDLEGLLSGTRTEVLATGDGEGALLWTLRDDPVPVAFVQLLVVHPARRRRGVARALIEAAHRRAAEAGAVSVQVGGAAPVYLYTGVDSRWLDALCCFEALGYTRTGVELDLVCPTRPPGRAGRLEGVELVRVRDEGAAAELARWCERTWPAWSEEFARAAAAGTVVVARAAGSDGVESDGVEAVLGAAAHSVGRLGVIGPVAVDPARHGGGIGAALLREVLAELSAAGLDRAEVAWVSTVRFYVQACGARVGRTSVVMRRDLGPVASGP